MRYFKIINFLLLILFSSFLYAEEKNDRENLYQIKLIMFSHDLSNYIDYDENYINDKFENINSVEIKKNNCLINNDNDCIKYDYDYKLENFNDYKDKLIKNDEIKVLSHLEWIQNINSKNIIKIKSGYDYSQEIIDEKILINDIDILSSGKISKYEGYVSVTKKKFYEINITLYERKKMKPPGFFSEEFLTSKKYHLFQKIKLNKIYYIDRDNFGILISLNKIPNN
tara:strand:- start:205 stop:882 length:678 start_codon:yes stop_codon:yes gene_type:complete